MMKTYIIECHKRSYFEFKYITCKPEELDDKVKKLEKKYNTVRVVGELEWSIRS